MVTMEVLRFTEPALESSSHWNVTQMKELMTQIRDVNNELIKN